MEARLLSGRRRQLAAQEASLLEQAIALDERAAELRAAHAHGLQAQGLQAQGLQAKGLQAQGLQAPTTASRQEHPSPMSPMHAFDSPMSFSWLETPSKELSKEDPKAANPTVAAQSVAQTAALEAFAPTNACAEPQPVATSPAYAGEVTLISFDSPCSYTAV